MRVFNCKNDSAIIHDGMAQIVVGVADVDDVFIEPNKYLCA